MIESFVDWGALVAPMDDAHVEWRVSRSGEKNGNPWATIVPYADCRFLMDRLDEVLGKTGWQTRVQVIHSGMVVPATEHERRMVYPPSVVVELGIFDGAVGEWIWKADAAEFTDFAPTKGGQTHAFRRACVPWDVAGIRLLYSINGPVFANLHEQGRYRDKIAGVWRNWDPPMLWGANGLLSGVTPEYEPHAAPASGGPPAASQAPSPTQSTDGGSVLTRRPPRGKYGPQKGNLTWGEIAETEPSYIEWAVSAMSGDWFTEAEGGVLLATIGAQTEMPVTQGAAPEEGEEWEPDDTLPF